MRSHSRESAIFGFSAYNFESVGSSSSNEMIFPSSSIWLVFTARRLCKEDGEKTDRVIAAPQKVVYSDLLRSNYISCSSVMMKRETAESCPMRSGNIHEDYLCWLELFKDGGYAAGINEPLLNYRSYRSSRSGSKLGSAAMTYRTYKRAGFGLIKRMGCMARYTVNGMKKYL